MEPLSFLANLLLMVTIGTLIFALVAYLAYKVRDQRRPKVLPTHASENCAEDELVFLRPYVPHMPSDAKQNDPDTPPYRTPRVRQ